MIRALSHVAIDGSAATPTRPLWLTVGGALGVLVATQPVGVSVILLALAIFVILGAVTPLSALAALLVVAPLRTLIATEADYPLPLDVGQIGAIVLIAMWVGYRIARRQSLVRIPLSPLILPLAAFLTATGVSAFGAASLGAWLTEWLKWVQMLVVVMLVLDLAPTGQWEALLFGLALSGVANALVGLYEFFGGSGALHLLIGERFFRAFGTFGQPNPFGGFMGLVAPVSIMAALGYGWRCWRRWNAQGRVQAGDLGFTLLYTVISFVIVAGLIASWSRGAWLGFGLAVLVMAFALPRKRWHRLLVIGVLVGGVAFVWFSGRLPASIVARLTSATEEFFAFDDVRGVDITPENYPVVERLAHWQAAVNMIQARPWSGVGYGNYEVAYPQYRLMNWHFPLGHAHNYYLNIWAEAGIIGFAAYCAVWLAVVWMTWRASSHPDVLARTAAIGLLGAWTYLSVHSLLDNLYVNNLFLHIGVMLGLVAVLYDQVCRPVSLDTI